MENTGYYDYAIFGDDLNALITAFLLRRQEERVVVIPEPHRRLRQSRLLYGYERGGLIQGLLKRWGIPDDFLAENTVDEPRVEFASGELTLALREPVTHRSLGSLASELRGPEGEEFLKALSSLEKDEAWLERFHQDLLEEIRRSHRGVRAWVMPSRNTARLWSRVLKRNLRSQVGASQLEVLKRWGRDASQSREEVRLLMEGVGSLMGPSRAGIRDLGSPLLQVLFELFAIRRTPFALGRGESITKQLRHYLKQTGVSFIDDVSTLKLGRNPEGRWEGTSGKEQAHLISFDHLVFAHSLSDRSMELFAEQARKDLEKELREEPSLYIEWTGQVPSSALPFKDRTELVASLSDYPVIHVSVQGRSDGVEVSEGYSHLSARTLLPSVIRLPPNATKLRLRFERVLGEIFPSVDSALAKDVKFQIEKHRDFPFGSGVRTRNSRIHHVNHASYPRLGEFGPFVAGIDLARRAARRRKKELML